MASKFACENVVVFERSLNLRFLRPKGGVELDKAGFLWKFHS